MKKSILFMPVIICLVLFSSFSDEFSAARDKMIRYQIRARGVTDEKVLSAMREVERHNFVPEGLKKRAYEDRPLPIGYGQTISQPYIVALMTELLELEEEHKVLEIGTGSGYQAAVLSRISRQVYTIEIVKELFEQVSDRFKRLDFENIRVRHSDGYFGLQEAAPFDRIIVTCAPAFVPPPLLEQLAPGGIMVIPVGQPFTVQQLLLIKKSDSGSISTTVVTDVLFVPLTREGGS